MTVTSEDPLQGYTITVYSKPDARSYTITKTASGISRSCTPAGQGGCNSSSSW